MRPGRVLLSSVHGIHRRRASLDRGGGGRCWGKGEESPRLFDSVHLSERSTGGGAPNPRKGMRRAHA